MNAELISLPRYEQCKHSVFISFAHDDDDSENGWVAALRDAIRARLKQLDNKIPQLEAHFSKDNGPTTGQLGHMLQDRVHQSFCMLLVVGRKYVASGWCERELEYFARLFGAEGARSRLLIAAMSEQAVLAAQRGTQWRASLPADQVWVQMFSEANRNSPLRARLDDGSFGADFFHAVTRLVDPLIEWIEQDYKAPITPGIGVTRAQPSGTLWSAQPGRRLRIGIGPYTEDMEGAVQSLAPLLERMHAEVSVLDRRLIDSYDPDEPEPQVRASLMACDVLVVPASYEKPLLPQHPGGHADILRAEWARLNKERGIVWFRPSGVRPPHAAGTLPKHLRVLDELAPICASEQAVVNLLFGQEAAEAVTFLVEKNDDAPAYFRLVRALQEGWARLPHDPDHPRPALQCHLIDLNDVTSVANHGDAFVLLFPVGNKALAALGSQQETIRKVFPRRGPVYPGLVAVIRDPPPENDVHVQSWTSVLFVRRSEELCVEDRSSQAWLQEFLNDVWRQYRQRVRSAETPALAG